MIVDVETTRAIRQAEVGAARTMIDRAMDRFGLWPEALIADTAYGSAPMLNWLVEERGIEPHIPVFDKSARRDGTFARADFAYDHRSDTYTCPNGKTLQPRRRDFAKPRSVVNQDDFIRYRASSPRLRRLPVEAAMLSQHARTQGHPVDLRRRAGHGPRDRRLRTPPPWTVFRAEAA